jgi:predicted AlkP superfamily pyrophosphatase or phosphodiesterase
MNKSTPRKPVFLVILVFAALFGGLVSCRGKAAPAPAGAGAKPRLLLFVVVDQLRPDVLEQLRPRFGPDGFRRVMEGGTWLTEARCGHFPTLTSVGHAVLFTGARTAEHGIAANDWADPETGERVYSLEDPGHAIVGRASRPHEGSSPRLLGSTTIGDELVLASAGRARVFAVSLKDRAAILGAGRMGKAFWFATDSGAFVTSTYYYASYPDWIAAWNGAHPADRLAGRSWELAEDAGGYRRAVADDRPAEKGYKTLGRTFPHPLPGAPGPALYDLLTYTPFGDELTVDFVEALFDAERPGQGQGTDMLAVGLTSTDYIGHAFGPASLEYEDQVLRLDRLLARLLAAADRHAGPGRTLIVLASDHGVDAIPESWAEKGWDAGRLDTEAIRGRVNSALRVRFGVRTDLVSSFWTPAFNIDRNAASAAGLDVEAVESAAAELLRREPGIAWALTRTELMTGRVPDAPLLRPVRSSVHPQRTGDIVVIQKPHWYLYEDAAKYSAMHGSPYAYDLKVPLGFAGPGIPAARVARAVELFDVAPTIAALLGIAPPSGSSGLALEEVLAGRSRR